MTVEKMRAFIIRFIFYCLILGLGYVCLKYVLPLLMPFLIGFLFAFILRPLIDFASRHCTVQRKIIAVLLLIVFYIFLTAITIVLGSRVAVLIRTLIGMIPGVYNDMIQPALISLQDTLENLFVNLDPAFGQSVERVGDALMEALSSGITRLAGIALEYATSFATSLPSALVKMLMTIISSFFFVADYDMLANFLLLQLSKDHREMLLKIKTKGIDVLLKFLRAYAILMTLTFVEMFIGLLLLRVDNALLIALVTAVVDILPILGTGTVLIPWGAALLILGNYPLGIGILLLYAIITVVRQTLEPRVVGNQIGLYPLATLACMFVGTYLFGVVGLFGLPIIATIALQLDRSGDIHIFHKEP